MTNVSRRAIAHSARQQAALWQQYRREPSADELAEAMQDEKEQVLVLLQHQQQVLSLEQPVYTEQESTLLGEQIAAPDDTEDTEQRERHQEVADLLKHLTVQERQVIEFRYQLGQAPIYGREDILVPYTAVGQHLQMSAELVKSVETRALRKLRFWAQRGQRLGIAQPMGAIP
jgi:RNA polymerase primary sigma factor